MAPTASTICNVTSSYPNCLNDTFGNWRDINEAEAFIVEGWGEGFMLGALLIMAIITVSHMRKGVLIHKLILLELLLAMSHGTFCFMEFHGYGFYLSSTAALLYCSYFTHNVIAWMKIKPFFNGTRPSFGPRFCDWVPRIYLTTLVLTAPVYLFEIFNNFRFFNNYSRLYETVRPYEPLMRDPWWVFSCVILFRVIGKAYGLNVFRLIARSPRFGIMLAAICLALAFTIIDILASIIKALSITDGINPYWKLALVFKCLSDNILLDDFKSVLQRLFGMNVDRNTATKSTSGIPNDGFVLRDHSEGDDANSTSRLRARSYGNGFDGFNLGSRKQVMTEHAVGRLGVKIAKLPTLSFLQFRSKAMDQHNGETEKTTDEENGSDASNKSRELPSWKHFDSETELTLPTTK